jgi:hypothetical protein
MKVSRLLTHMPPSLCHKTDRAVKPRETLYENNNRINTTIRREPSNDMGKYSPYSVTVMNGKAAEYVAQSRGRCKRRQ